MITAAQIRAARHLLGISQEDLANATHLSKSTIRRAETDRDVFLSEEALATIVEKLQQRGVTFICTDRTQGVIARR